MRGKLRRLWDWLDEAPAGGPLRWTAVGVLCLSGLIGWAALAPPAPPAPALTEPARLDPALLRSWAESQHPATGSGQLRVGALNLDLPAGQDTYVYLSVDQVPAPCRSQACQLILEAAAPGEGFAMVEPGIAIDQPMAMMMPFEPGALGPHHLRAAIRTPDGHLATSEATRYWARPPAPRGKELLESGVSGLFEPRLLLLFPGLLALFLQLGARRRRRIPEELQLMYRIEDEDPASIAAPTWQVVPVRVGEARSLRQSFDEAGPRAALRQLAAHFRSPEVSVAELLDPEGLRERVKIRLRPGDEGEVRIESETPFHFRRQSDRSASRSEGETSLPLGSLLAVDRVQLVLGYPEMVEAMREGILRVPEVPRLPATPGKPRR